MNNQSMFKKRLSELFDFYQHLRVETHEQYHDSELHPPPGALNHSRPFLIGFCIFLIIGPLVTFYISSIREHKIYSGNEAEWLTSSIYSAVTDFYDIQRIALWQPYLEMGEPLAENPFTPIFNPFNLFPSIVLGPEIGVLVSIMLHIAITIAGGWFLGWSLGIKLPYIRLILIVMLLAKGSMLGGFASGYYQLSASQAYFPWIIGGMIGIVRGHPRPSLPVLTGVSFAMLWLSGNIWYTLPMLICCAAITLICIRTKEQIRSVLAAGAITIGISAVTLIPGLVNQSFIGRHPPEIGAGLVLNSQDVFAVYFSNDMNNILHYYDPRLDQYQSVAVDRALPFYYHFVWPGILIGILFFPYFTFRWDRLWLVFAGLIGLFTLWGMGGRQPFLWLYENFPLLAQWRFVGRAFAISSFFMAIVIAIRLDSAWFSLSMVNWSAVLHRHTIPEIHKDRAHYAPVQIAAASIYAVVLIGSLFTLTRSLYAFQRSLPFNSINTQHPDDLCVSYLRAQYPDEFLTVWKNRYDGIVTHIKNDIRTLQIQADFTMNPLPSTIEGVDLIHAEPFFYTPFALPWDSADRAAITAAGYLPVEDSPLLLQTGLPCLHQHTQPAAPYIFFFDPKRDNNERIEHYQDLYPRIQTVQPLAWQHEPDTIQFALQSTSDKPQLAVVQEKAYPGWRVWLDGSEVDVQSVGGMIGLYIPGDGGIHTVEFAYRPVLFVISAVITILTACACMGYLFKQIIFG